MTDNNAIAKRLVEAADKAYVSIFDEHINAQARAAVAAVLHELAAYCVEVGTDLNDSDFYEWADDIESGLLLK